MTKLSTEGMKLTIEADGVTVSSLNLYILANDDPAHDNRPFASVEHVTTLEEHRRQGYASRLLRRAEEIARERNCYKITLSTSSKKESVHRLYQKAGYDGSHKMLYYKKLDSSSDGASSSGHLQS